MQNIVDSKDMFTVYKTKIYADRALKNYQKWFPVKSSAALAGIIADLMGDGHLQGNPKWRIDYTSNSKSELNRFGKEIFILFGIRGKIRKCNTNKYGTMNYGINCKPLARVLNLCGAPSGAKVLKEFDIPSWILENKKYFKKFISRLFSCEATVDKEGYIEIQMNKSIDLLESGSIFFFQIKDGLEKHFGIKSTNSFTDNRVVVRKDGIKTKPIRLKIKRRQSVQKFATLIGFEDKVKQKKLLKAISRL